MALRNQPYIPLYVQDFLTDEKLNECSATATGVYIKIMCIMHKSEEYGTILLKQKDKQSGKQEVKQIDNFACKLVRHLPFTEPVIRASLEELLEEGVLYISGNKLCQKRMIKDNNISIKRSKSGKKGGLKTQQFVKANTKANVKANSESENESENESESIISYIKNIEENWKPNIAIKTNVSKETYEKSVDEWIENLLSDKGKKTRDEIKEKFSLPDGKSHLQILESMRDWLVNLPPSKRKTDLIASYRNILRREQ